MGSTCLVVDDRNLSPKRLQYLLEQPGFPDPRWSHDPQALSRMAIEDRPYPAHELLLDFAVGDRRVEIR